MKGDMTPTASPQPPRSAAEWFALVRSGSLDAQADHAWQQWMLDPAHAQAYDDCELAWTLSADTAARPALRPLLADVERLMAKPARIEPAASASERIVPFKPAATRLRPGTRWQSAIAASVLAAGMCVYWFGHRQTELEYRTGVGEQRPVTLADGSSVTLNTDTRMRVAYSHGARRVQLLRGEALFKVAHDPARPFEVQALAGTTTATGTRFDVQLTDDQARVSVLEGAVTVVGDAHRKDGEVVSLVAGQGLDYTVDGQHSSLRAADATRIAAWQVQRIVFSDVPLATALKDYNRYVRTPVLVQDPELAQRHINGVFHLGDEAAFLGALQQGLHVSIDRGASQTLLRPNTP